MKKAVIDIDGVLNYYPETILQFISDKLGVSFESLNSAKSNLSYYEYNLIKAQYRNSDYKHNATVRKGAKKLLNYLTQHDYLIYIITSRELYKNDMLEKTICWLKKNELRYDFIYESRKKDFTIFEKFNDIDIVIEDNVDNIKNIMKVSNAKCYNIINSDNFSLSINCKRVNDLNDIIVDLERTNDEIL